MPLRLLIASQKSFREGLRAAKNFLESLSALVTAFLGFFYLCVSLGRLLNTTKDTGYGVAEICKCHSRGEEYGVTLKRPVGTTADWRGMVLVRGRPVSAAN